jgi:CheY-like chemotaxis protein
MLSDHVANAARRLRVLVVEDSFFAARTIARLVQDFGATVVGPVPSVGQALEVIEREGCDAAVLDINLGAETVEAVAERLETLGRPFVFVTGYASPGVISERFKGRTKLSKPVEKDQFLKTLEQEFVRG